MPSPFLQFIEFPTLSEAQVSTLETVSELFWTLANVLSATS